LSALGVIGGDTTRNNDKDSSKRKNMVKSDVAAGKDVDEEKKPSVAAAAAAAKKQPEVVDLLWTDSSDEEEEDSKLPPPRPAKKRQRSGFTPQQLHSKKRGPSSTSSAAAAGIKKAPQPSSDSTPGVGSGESPLRFQIAIWNVWFGLNGQGFPHLNPRMEALTRLIGDQHPQQDKEDHNNSSGEKYPLWFVGLQEVTVESLPLLERGLREEGFNHFVPQSNAFVGGGGYFCVLALRKGFDGLKVLESGWRDYQNTDMGRGFCYARVRVGDGEGGGELLVATTHLESWCSPQMTGAEDRRLQLLEWQDFCRQQFARHDDLRACILAGDLNWDDDRKNPTDALVADVVTIPHHDAWLQYAQNQKFKGQAAKGYTYDCKLNPMMGGNLRRRFDRCLVFPRSASHRVACTRTELMGREALPGLYFDKTNSYTGQSKTYPTAPSDHFGFCASLEIS